MIDLDNEQDRFDLSYACNSRLGRLEGTGLTSADIIGCFDPVSGRKMKEACETLSDPAKAAELIRRLVERAGLRVVDGASRERSFEKPPGWIDGSIICAFPFWFVPYSADQTIREIKDILATIARLLALAPGAGADAVLAALRGET